VSDARICESEFVVRSELGLHARPASQFVSLAGRFRASIRVSRGDEWVDGRSILSLLSLAAGRGTALRIRAEGDDAAEAVAALGRLLEETGASPGAAN
jgi:phosphotransferase system HPr (HPr) family protein